MPLSRGLAAFSLTGDKISLLFPAPVFPGLTWDVDESKTRENNLPLRNSTETELWQNNLSATKVADLIYPEEHNLCTTHKFYLFTVYVLTGCLLVQEFRNLEKRVSHHK